MSRFALRTAVFLMLLIFLRGSHISNAAGVVEEPKSRCLESERQALLKFKEELHELKEGLLSSWGHEEEKTDCCKWIGIRCNKKSGHVIMLDLSPTTFGRKIDSSPMIRKLAEDAIFFNTSSEVTSLWSLRGNNISPSLSELQYLNYLDLSFNNLTGISIPSFLSTLSNLRYLNLSFTYMSGDVPPQLANLSRLQSLDFTNTYLKMKSLDWVSHLSSLRQLALGGTDLSEVNNDFRLMVNKLPSLESLELQSCHLPYFDSSSLSIVNSSMSLAVLDISFNLLSISAYQWLFNFSNLVYLDLFGNHVESSILEAFGNMNSLAYLGLTHTGLEGSIPESFGNMTALSHLELGYNKLEGEIPKSIWKLPRLRVFLVNFNNLCGQLPESVGQLSGLERLDVSSNSLEGVISEAHFTKLTKLYYLGLSSNSFTLNISLDWVPPFKLDAVLLGSCKLGPQFPKWLQTQMNYSLLDISNAGISDSIPNWFWDLSTEVLHMNLSNNNFSGKIPNPSSDFTNYPEIDMSFNYFEGPVPLFLFKVAALHLFSNRFSKLNAICNFNDDALLSFLDISSNQLFGELPDCWSHFKELHVLLLANNKLSGKIPISIGSLTQVKTLHLGNNKLTGELPSSLINCRDLVVFDVGENNLLGPIPQWIGASLSNLVFLSLRSNHFYGSMPTNLCHLAYLQLLDFSSNDISGSVLKCVNNFTAMKESGGTIEFTTVDYLYMSNKFSSGELFNRSYSDEIQLVWKGTLRGYHNTLKLVKGIDLSCNMLTGEIPREMTELTGLVSLNLSRNSLSGKIPSDIGRLKLLDALDLSNNQLSGRLPQSLSQIDRFNKLDLSNNKFSGKIPISPHFQSFEDAFNGNPELCGAPLPKNCRGVESTHLGATDEETSNQEDQDGFVSDDFYLSVALGFVVGFLGVCVMLLFNKSCSNASSIFLNNTRDWFYKKKLLG